MKYLIITLLLAFAACSKTDVKPDPALTAKKVIENITIEASSTNPDWLAEDMIKAETAIVLTPIN